MHNVRLDKIAAVLCFLLAALLTPFLRSGSGERVHAAPPAEGDPTPRVYLPLLIQGSNPPATVTPEPTQTVTPDTPFPTPAVTPPPSAGDWAMVAANPQRTSWTAEEVRGNLKVAWYRPLEPYIPYKIQPIAANGNIYVSTARGLYAFRATDGTLLWVYPTELPLGNSPTIAQVNGKSVAYAPGYDHKIHAIDTSNGIALSGYTPYEADAGFETNPLVINDSFTGNQPTIFAGSRDGNFYALDARTGAKKWSFLTGGPILFSAAYKNGVLYFASQDNNAYALRAGDGSQIWVKGGFEGAGFHSFWPVIYTEKTSGKDFVIFSGSENYRFQDNNNTFPWSALYLLDQVSIWGSCWTNNNCSSKGLIWTKTTDNSSNNYWGHPVTKLDVSAITNYYESQPARRTQFILNAANGQEYTFDSDGDGKLEYAPITFAGGISSAGNKYPPIINGWDNVYYQDVMYNNSGASYAISRGDPVGWKWGDHFVSMPSTDNGHAVDEPIAFSSGGKIIYWNLCCDREAGAWDTASAGTRWQYWSYNLLNLAPDYDPTYNDGSASNYATAITNPDGFQIFSGKNQSKNGIYMKHMTSQSPPVPYQGKVYFIKGNTLLALAPSGSATKLPMAGIIPTESAPTPPTSTQLRQQLESEIQKMIAAGHLRPGYYSHGLLDILGSGGYPDERGFGELFEYFQNPADTVYTLLLAYPYLSATTQANVKNYIQTYYAPGTTYDFTKIVHIGWGTGAQREIFKTPQQAYSVWGSAHKPPLNPSTEPICGGCGYWLKFPPFNFYAGWKYAQVFGNNAAAAQSILDAMSNNGHPTPEAPPTDASGNLTPYVMHKPYFLNLYAAGYLGYLNLRQMAGLPDDTTVRGYYNKVMAARTNNFLSTFKDTPYWNTGGCGNDYGPCYNRTFAVARNFMFLTPEIADYMNNHISAADLNTTLNEYEYVAPYWFVSKFDSTVGEGTMEHLYDYPALFQAKAWVLKQPYSELAKWLDVPAFARGDLFYIQNLTAALAVAP